MKSLEYLQFGHSIFQTPCGKSCRVELFANTCSRMIPNARRGVSAGHLGKFRKLTKLKISRTMILLVWILAGLVAASELQMGKNEKFGSHKLLWGVCKLSQVCDLEKSTGISKSTVRWIDLEEKNLPDEAALVRQVEKVKKWKPTILVGEGTFGQILSIGNNAVLKVGKLRWKPKDMEFSERVKMSKRYVEAEAIVQSRVYGMIQEDQRSEVPKYPNILVPKVSLNLLSCEDPACKLAPKKDAVLGIVMEKISGDDLFDVLTKPKLMSKDREAFLKNQFPTEVVDFILDVDERGEYIPNLPDVKPENIVLGKNTAYFIDFDMKSKTPGICPPKQFEKTNVIKINNSEIPVSECNQLVGVKSLLISVCVRVYGDIQLYADFDQVYKLYGENKISLSVQPIHHVAHLESYENMCLQKAPHGSSFHKAFEKLNDRIANTREISYYSFKQSNIKIDPRLMFEKWAQQIAKNREVSNYSFKNLKSKNKFEGIPRVIKKFLCTVKNIF
jgi:serine/threonine protein kinase